MPEKKFRDLASWGAWQLSRIGGHRSARTLIFSWIGTNQNSAIEVAILALPAHYETEYHFSSKILNIEKKIRSEWSKNIKNWKSFFKVNEFGYLWKMITATKIKKNKKFNNSMRLSHLIPKKDKKNYFPFA